MFDVEEISIDEVAEEASGQASPPPRPRGPTPSSSGSMDVHFTPSPEPESHPGQDWAEEVEENDPEVEGDGPEEVERGDHDDHGPGSSSGVQGLSSGGSAKRKSQKPKKMPNLMSLTVPVPPVASTPHNPWPVPASGGVPAQKALGAPPSGRGGGHPRNPRGSGYKHSGLSWYLSRGRVPPVSAYGLGRGGHRPLAPATAASQPEFRIPRPPQAPSVSHGFLSGLLSTTRPSVPATPGPFLNGGNMVRRPNTLSLDLSNLPPPVPTLGPAPTLGPVSYNLGNGNFSFPTNGILDLSRPRPMSGGTNQPPPSIPILLPPRTTEAGYRGQMSGDLRGLGGFSSVQWRAPESTPVSLPGPSQPVMPPSPGDIRGLGVLVNTEGCAFNFWNGLIYCTSVADMVVTCRHSTGSPIYINHRLISTDDDLIRTVDFICYQLDVLNLWLLHGRVNRRDYYSTLQKVDEFLYLDKLRPALQRFRDTHGGDTPTAITRREVVACYQGRPVHMPYEGGYTSLMLRPQDWHECDVKIMSCFQCSQ